MAGQGGATMAERIDAGLSVSKALRDARVVGLFAALTPEAVKVWVFLLSAVSAGFQPSTREISVECRMPMSQIYAVFDELERQRRCLFVIRTPGRRNEYRVPSPEDWKVQDDEVGE